MSHPSAADVIRVNLAAIEGCRETAGHKPYRASSAKCVLQQLRLLISSADRIWLPDLIDRAGETAAAAKHVTHQRQPNISTDLNASTPGGKLMRSGSCLIA
jgi:hypothetical protein